MKTARLSALRSWRVSAIAAVVAFRLGTVAVSFVYALVVGPAQFAPVAMMLVLVPLGTMISTLGVDQAFFREMVNSRRARPDLRSALRLVSIPLAMCPILALAFSVVASALGYSCAVFAIAGACSAIQALSVLIISAHRRATTDSVKYAVMFISIACVSACTRLVLLFATSLPASVSWVAGDAAAAVLSVAYAARWLLSLSQRKDEGLILCYKRLLGYGGPMTLHGCFQWVLGSADRFIISGALGPTALGTYGAVYQFAAVYNAAASELNKTGLHRYANSVSATGREVASRDRRVLLALWLIALPFVIGAFYVLQQRGYSSAVGLGTCLYVSFLPLVVYLPIANRVSITVGSARAMGLSSGLGAVANVTVNMVFVHQLNTYVGAVANIAGYAVMALVLVATYRASLSGRVSV